MKEPGQRPDSPPPEGIPTLRLPVNPLFPESRVEQPPSSFRRWSFGLLALAILGGTLGYYLVYPSGDSPASFQRREELPPILVPYADRAAQGDPSAMYMLGTMYYNGLNVRQNRKEGIKWYRKAAAAGSIAARKDLEQLGLTVDGQ